MSIDPTSLLSRREFTAMVASAATVPLFGSCRAAPTAPSLPSGTRMLPRPESIAGRGTLVAATGQARITPELSVDAWTLGGTVPSPTIRVRTGDLVAVQLQNSLPLATTVHWHGLLVPSDSDGHPRNAVAPNQSFLYSFPIVQRAGTFWYHPHAHHNTALQVHRGMAGFLIVGDAEEDSLGLPAGNREILLMLQDRGTGLSDGFLYHPTAADLQHGMLRSTVFGNGLPTPAVEVGPGPYRLRILNASHARVYRVGLADGQPLTLIGNDGGLLPSVVTTSDAWLGVGERLDCIVDLSGLPVGERTMLRSSGFTLPGQELSTSPQGAELDLLAFHRIDGADVAPMTLPEVLSTVEPLPAAVLSRTFAFSSAEGEAAHRIAGQVFDMHRIDLQIPFNQCEDWTFRNDSTLPHPVHVHGCHFQLMSRTGGRNRLFGHEAGWKDTALVMPGEAVTVRLRFNAYPGLFLLHCHNLQHEDMGMMLNIEVNT